MVPSKNFIKNYWCIILTISLYLMGYLVAFPNVTRSFIYFYYIGDTIIDIVEKTFIFTVLLVVLAVLYKFRLTRIFSIIGIGFVSINFSLSFYFRILFKKDFDTGIALSFFNTNTSEAYSLLQDYNTYIYILLFILYFYISVKTISNISKIKFSVTYYIIVICSIISILFYDKVGYKTVYYDKNIEKFRPEKRKYFSNLYPIYYLNELIVAYEFSNDLRKIKSFKPNYSNLEPVSSDIENIVLIIGESARRENMSLYGYNRDTTPNELKESENMLLYTNAVSPGPLTLISIPMMLSNAMPDDYSYSSPKYADNILTLANYIGFETHWITTQKFPGQDTSLISIFENYAKNIYRIDGVYDEKILSPFKEVVGRNKNKKLIILHINGSHATFCDKYPSSESYFTGAPNNIDCYDNSIRYTDKVIGHIFEILKETKSVLLYASDHGVSLYKQRMTFSNTKDQTKVPMYLWYSPQLLLQNSNYKLGKISTRTQTTILYPLISNLLLGKDKDYLPESKEYTSELRFVNSDLSVVDYESLKESLEK